MYVAWHEPKQVATHYHAQVGFPDKDCTIKEWLSFGRLVIQSSKLIGKTWFIDTPDTHVDSSPRLYRLGEDEVKQG